MQSSGAPFGARDTDMTYRGSTWSPEVQQACFCCLVATFAVESQKVRFEIDVQPLNATLPAHFGSQTHKSGSDPFSLVIRAYRSVEDEPMKPSVPRDVDKTYEKLTVIRTNVCQTAREYVLNVRSPLGLAEDTLCLP